MKFYIFYEKISFLAFVIIDLKGEPVLKMWALTNRPGAVQQLQYKYDPYIAALVTSNMTWEISSHNYKR